MTAVRNVELLRQNMCREVLCKNCYDQDIEKRHKDVDRIRNRGGSSSVLTKEYL